MDKSHMFFGNKDVHYKDGHSIPWATYRCKANVKRVDSHAVTPHQCKLVTDHPHQHICICGQEFGGLADVC